MDNAKLLLLELEGAALEVVDVLQDPQRAEDARILATPTLVREWPLPVRILVGDLSNFDRVRALFNLPMKRKESAP